MAGKSWRAVHSELAVSWSGVVSKYLGTHYHAVFVSFRPYAPLAVSAGKRPHHVLPLSGLVPLQKVYPCRERSLLGEPEQCYVGLVTLIVPSIRVRLGRDGASLHTCWTHIASGQ